jgi:hypothetical protein
VIGIDYVGLYGPFVLSPTSSGPSSLSQRSEKQISNGISQIIRASWYRPKSRFLGGKSIYDVKALRPASARSRRCDPPHPDMTPIRRGLRDEDETVLCRGVTSRRSLTSAILHEGKMGRK